MVFFFLAVVLLFFLFFFFFKSESKSRLGAGTRGYSPPVRETEGLLTGVPVPPKVAAGFGGNVTKHSDWG